jgi:phosphoglucosamine mutase
MAENKTDKRLFGTDGIRGRANLDLTPELAFRVGCCVAGVLAAHSGRPRILIGRDTRCSGEMLEAALSAGVAAAGGEAELLGVVPTAAVALLTREWGADAGAVISASHNPMEDNGIKIFHRTGYKLPDEMEMELEEAIAGAVEVPRPHGREVGRIRQAGDALECYLGYLRGLLSMELEGCRMVLDCANGAACGAAPQLFESYGAEVVTIFNEPDGYNINQGCGSTKPQRLQEVVRQGGADLGLAFDGDADRVIVVDERGDVLDGDVIMAACAERLQRRGELSGQALVATVMSNKGFHLAMRDMGITVHQSAVGDRYVLEEMLKRGLNLGGEQSGHIIFLDHSPTGDGLLTALHFLRAWKERGGSVSEIGGMVRRFPQVLLNVRVPGAFVLEGNQAVEEGVKEVEERLGEQGRVLIRLSGTEPLVRVMVEAPTEEEAEGLARELAAVIEAECAASGVKEE